MFQVGRQDEQRHNLEHVLDKRRGDRVRRDTVRMPDGQEVGLQVIEHPAPSARVDIGRVPVN